MEWPPCGLGFPLAEAWVSISFSWMGTITGCEKGSDQKPGEKKEVTKPTPPSHLRSGPLGRQRQLQHVVTRPARREILGAEPWTPLPTTNNKPRTCAGLGDWFLHPSHFPFEGRSLCRFLLFALGTCGFTGNDHSPSPWIPSHRRSPDLRLPRHHPGPQSVPPNPKSSFASAHRRLGLQIPRTTAGRHASGPFLRCHTNCSAAGPKPLARPGSRRAPRQRSAIHVLQAQLPRKVREPRRESEPKDTQTWGGPK